MDDPIVWGIILLFFAPLHYLLPVLILFITGSESPAERKRLLRRTLVDSTVSMLLAFAAAIWLTQQGWLMAALVLLMLAMLYPVLQLLRMRQRIDS